MVLVDSNIILIDRFFRQDARYQINRTFLDKLDRELAGISIFTLLELCGVASFNLNDQELALWLYSFDQVYPIRVLDPYVSPPNATIKEYLIQLGNGYVTRGMTFGDAVLLKEAEAYEIGIVTWNPKHFRGKGRVPVLTPEEWLAAQA